MPEDPALNPVSVRREGARRQGAGAPLRRLWYLLLLAECVVVLVPSIYARESPKLAGIPFFYWYQMLWVIISAILTALVYLLTRSGGTLPAQHARDEGSE